MGYALDGTSNESTPYNHRPGMGYNETKRDAEVVALERSAGHLELMIVRPTLISGPGPFRRGAVASLIHRSLRQRLWVSPRGGVNVVDVRDVVRMLLAAMDTGSNQTCYLAAGHDLPSHDLIRKIATATGRRKPLFCAPRVLTDALGSGCQALESLGFRPPIPADTLRLAGRILYYDNRWSLAALGLPQPIDLDETLSRQINWERRHL
jgi:nucleoside-diphosphate-sugar epimerase